MTTHTSSVDFLHVQTAARTNFNIKSTILTMSKLFCLCLCEYVKYDCSNSRARNEFVSDGHKMPLTILPRLNAAE